MGDELASGDDPDDAARLERALERIAALSRQRQAAAVEPVPDAEIQEVTARLDALIAQLRGAIDRPE